MSSPARRAISFSLKWQITILLALIAAVNYSDRAAISTVLAAVRQDMGLSNIALGSVGGMFLWSYALASPLAGIVADRAGRGILIVASLAAWSLVTMLTGFVNSLATLLAMRFLLGLCESFFLPSATALLAERHTARSRGTAMAILSTGVNCGVILGGTCAGYLAQHFGWRTAFRAFGFVGLLLAPVAAQMIRSGPKRQPGEPAGRPFVAAELKKLFTLLPFLILLVQALFAGAGTWILLSWLPLYFGDQFAFNLTSAGFYGTFLLQLPASIGIVAGGWASDKLAEKNLRNRMLSQAVMYIVAAPFLMLFLGRPAFLVAAAAVAVFSVLRGMGQASENPAICEVVPSHLRSTAIGLMNASYSASGGVGVLLAGVFKERLGLAGVFACVAILFVTAGGLLLLGHSIYHPMPQLAFEMANGPDM